MFGLDSGTNVNNERPVDAAIRSFEEFTQLEHKKDFYIVANCSPITVYSKEKDEEIAQVMHFSLKILRDFFYFSKCFLSKYLSIFLLVWNFLFGCLYHKNNKDWGRK